MKNQFITVERSLTDMFGEAYIRSACAACAVLTGKDRDALFAAAAEKTEFYPEAMQNRLAGMLEQVGTQVMDAPIQQTSVGAGTVKFNEALNANAAPVSAFGYYRVGEDGRLYLTTKSEHYHTPLGHSFPGYGLLDQARELNIPNATHNNTRGYITRILEEELIRTANGLERGDQQGLESVMAITDDLKVLNRVINLETGSLAVEAALKMILARFFRIQAEAEEPKYLGRIPVILCMGNDEGGASANYHGTTTLTQMMRGMWPELRKKIEAAELWKVVHIRPNNKQDLDDAFAKYDQGDYKIAGFFHEIVMMNYGGRRLTTDFLQHAYQLCDEHDVATVCDEIQSCMWASELYLFREYGITPTFVAIGKGFPGGEYPASRILFSAAMDSMPQFGALVTNGQEELAAMAYLVTMEWAQANTAVTKELGAYFEQRVRKFAAAYPEVIASVDGWQHMSTIQFSDLEKAKAFVSEISGRGMDISAQTYKADCPPVVLTKIPLIADRAMIDFFMDQMNDVMTALTSKK
jgi:acetylornithine/succinyldiaminopimelate/putrescine aminotransferase